MKVSIITVCWNSVGTIARAIKSVSDQTYLDIEYIVVDGCSTDGTLDVVRAHSDQIDIIISEPDAGIYDAMNKGLSLASGDVVGFINSDDWLTNESVIDRVVSSFRESDIDVVYGDVTWIGLDGEEVRRWKAGEFSKFKMLFGWMPPHPGVYFRPASLGNDLRFETQYRIAADYHFLTEMFLIKRVKSKYLGLDMVHMLVGGASQSGLAALKKKSLEDYRIAARFCSWPLLLVICKNLRSIPQFIVAYLNKFGY